MRFITGEIKEPSSRYRYWAIEAEANWRYGPTEEVYEWCMEQWGERGEMAGGVWNWSFTQAARTGRYSFVNAQDMTLFLLRWT